MLTFGLGTLTESINAIFGWSEWNTKIWYIVGALLGGYPLAQGTIYLLMKKRFADISAVVCSAVILVAAVCVLLSPIEIPEGFDQRLTGRVFAWQWVRGFSPLLNLYAFVFLFGGAVYSAIKYFAKDREEPVSSATSSLPLVRFFPALAELHPVRLRGGVVHHGIDWTGVHLLRLPYDEEGPLRILACQSAGRWKGHCHQLDPLRERPLAMRRTMARSRSTLSMSFIFVPCAVATCAAGAARPTRAGPANATA